MRLVLHGSVLFLLVLGTSIHGVPRLRVVNADGGSTSVLRPGVPAIVDVIVPDEQTADATVTIDNLPPSAIRTTSTSTSMSSMNGVMRSEVCYRYTVVLNTPGSYTIGPAHIKTASGDVQESNTVSITVRAENPAEKSQDPSALTIRLAVERTELMQGELVPLTLRAQVPHNYTVRGLRPEIPPSLHVYGHFEPHSTQNTEYSELLTRVSIAPRATGTITLPAWSLELEDRSARRNPFAFFGFFGGQTAQAYSNSVTLHVTPLPEGCAFAGVLHAATLNMEKNSCVAGEAISATLVLDVTADRDAITAIPLKVPEGLRLYVASVAREGDGPRGAVRMRYTVHALKQGSYALAGNVLKYFDTTTRAVRTVALAAPTITVDPAPAGMTVPKVEMPTEVAGIEEVEQQEPSQPFNLYHIRMRWSWWFILMLCITNLCFARSAWRIFSTSRPGKKVLHKVLVLRTRRALYYACAQHDGAAAHRIAVAFFARNKSSMSDNAWMARLERCAFDRSADPNEYDAIAAEVNRWIV